MTGIDQMRRRFLVVLSIVVLFGQPFGAAASSRPRRSTTSKSLLELKRKRLVEWKRRIAAIRKRADGLSARGKTLRKQIAEKRKRLDALKKKSARLESVRAKAAEKDRGSSRSLSAAGLAELVCPDRWTSLSAVICGAALAHLAVQQPGPSTSLDLCETILLIRSARTRRPEPPPPRIQAGPGKRKTKIVPSKPAAEKTPSTEAIRKLTAEIRKMEDELSVATAGRKACLGQMKLLGKLVGDLESDIKRLESEQRIAAARKSGSSEKSASRTPARSHASRPPPKTRRKTALPANIKPGTGLDVLVGEGTAIHAIESGTVMYAGRFEGYGNLVILEHPDGALSLYGFLKEILVRTGGKVSRGQLIGRSGFIEDRDRAGLRFEMRVMGSSRSGLIDPRSWLPKGADFRRRILQGTD